MNLDHRRPRWRVAAFALCSMATAAFGGLPTVSAAPLRPQLPPASQRVFMVSDSVGLGAKAAMTRAFPADWQVFVTGQPALFVEQLVERYVQYQPASVFGDYAIVAGGYNYPYWDPPRFDRSIDLMVNTLVGKGVKHVLWVTMREVKPAYFSGWSSLSSNYKTLYQAYPRANQQLRDAQLRHPELSIIDWASVSDRPGLTYDAIHLNTYGASEYSGLAAGTVATVANRLPAGTVTAVPVAGLHGVPADAKAVALNVTVVNPRVAGYLTVYPCGATMPVVSNLNFRAAQVVASTAVVPVGGDGAVCVYQSAAAHVIVDLNGSFAATSGFVPVTPTRMLDTRGGAAAVPGQVTRVHLGSVEGTPPAPFTAFVNLTGLGNFATSEVRLFTCGTTPPAVPARSVEPGFDQSVPVVVTTDAGGDVCLTVSQPIHLLVDLFGALPADADLHPLPAERVLDTRGGPMPTGGSVLTERLSGLTGDAPPSGAWLTLTLTAPQAIGWATAYPCADGLSSTSLVNVVPNHQQTASGLVPADANGEVCVYVSTTSHVMVDLVGWAGTAFTPFRPVRLVDTRAG